MESVNIKDNWIGKKIEELPTPALVADLDAIEANINLLSDYFDKRRCRLRPHFKSHKCVTLAGKQLAAGNTAGITCAKVSEAEQLVAGGIQNVLIANQVIGSDKARRLARLNRQARVCAAVDSMLGVEQLDLAACQAGVKIGVLVEVDIGMNRGGVLPGEPVLKLAELIARTPGLTFEGLQSYEGHLITLDDFEQRRELVTEAFIPVLETREKLLKKGFPIIVSSGGTGTYDITGNLEGIDELQCGSYVLMDTAYKKIRPEFNFARFILSTVISKRNQTATADVGIKGMGVEGGTPEIIGAAQTRVLYVAEEHTVIENIDAAVGEKICLIPPHGCTTNNLYANMWITRNGIIEDIWQIEGRGCLE